MDSGGAAAPVSGSAETARVAPLIASERLVVGRPPCDGAECARELWADLAEHHPDLKATPAELAHPGDAHGSQHRAIQRVDRDRERIPELHGNSALARDSQAGDRKVFDRADCAMDILAPHAPVPPLIRDAVRFDLIPDVVLCVCHRSWHHRLLSWRVATIGAKIANLRRDRSDRANSSPDGASYRCRRTPVLVSSLVRKPPRSIEISDRTSIETKDPERVSQSKDPLCDPLCRPTPRGKPG